MFTRHLPGLWHLRIRVQLVALLGHSLWSFLWTSSSVVLTCNTFTTLLWPEPASNEDRCSLSWLPAVSLDLVEEGHGRARTNDLPSVVRVECRLRRWLPAER